MSIQKEVDDATKYFYDIEHSLEDGNINLCRQFGYVPNLTLLNSNIIPIDKMLEYVRLQTRSIQYRIQNKTTYNGYYINFRMIGIPGDVYSAFYDQNKLIRSLDWGQIFYHVNTANFSKPFIQMIANKTLSFSIQNKLDDGHIMDAAPPLFLDSAVSSQPTNHIFCEYILNSVLESPMLIDDRYLRYLEDGSQYTRSVKHYVHNGVQLNIPMYSSPAYDFLIPNDDYSINDLQLSSCVAYQYIRRYIVSGASKLDDGRTLDEDITYQMDGSDTVSNPITLSDFAYISIGGGTSKQPSMSYANVLNDSNRILFYYTLNDDADSLVFKDYSSNNYNLISDDLQSFNLDSFGNTISFSGVPLHNDEISLSSSNYTISFWYRPTMNSDTQCIFDFDFLKLNYNNLQARLELTFESVQYNFPINDLEHYIDIELNTSDNTLYFFIDTILITSKPITVSIAGLRTLYIGTNSSKSLSSAFYGMIAEFSMISGFLTQDQKDYIYENKLQLITKLHNFYNRTRLSSFEKAESNDSIYLAATSYNEAFLLSDEFIFKYDSVVERYTNVLKNNNIIPKSVSVQVRHLIGSGYTISTFKDNGVGSFNSIGNEIDENYLISGTIDYTTGQYLIGMYTIKRVINLGIIALPYGVPINQAQANLKYNVQPLSLSVTYTIDDVVYTAKDDGFNSLTGVYISTGTIQYDTGVLDITFSTDIDVGTGVNVTYDYKITPVIDEGESIYVSYNTTNQLDVTEVALEDQNKNVLAYATFPPIRFNNRYNYLNTAFIIRKIQ